MSNNPEYIAIFDDSEMNRIEQIRSETGVSPVSPAVTNKLVTAETLENKGFLEVSPVSPDFEPFENVKKSEVVEGVEQLEKPLNILSVNTTTINMVTNLSNSEVNNTLRRIVKVKDKTKPNFLPLWLRHRSEKAQTKPDAPKSGDTGDTRPYLSNSKGLAVIHPEVTAGDTGDTCSDISQITCKTCSFWLSNDPIPAGVCEKCPYPSTKDSVEPDLSNYEPLPLPDESILF